MMFEKGKEIFGFVSRQTMGFFEIVLLKLRIIGFSNKRSGLMTKLGEAVFKTTEAGEAIGENDDVERFFKDIRESDLEIADAEKLIIEQRSKGHDDREKFRNSRNKKDLGTPSLPDKNPATENKPDTGEAINKKDGA